MDKELVIRFGGIGGQGIVMCGIIYGEAAMKQGYHVVQSQSYGSTTRGGTTYSDVIISNEEILGLHPEAIDILIAMSQDALEAYLPLLKKGGLLLINTTMVTQPSSKAEYKIFGLPVTQLAMERFSRPIISNIIMLGFTAKIVSLVKADILLETVLNRVPPNTIELNKTAFNIGLNYELSKE